MVWVPIFMVVHSTQVYILLKPLFSRHKGIGVQFTDEPTGALDRNSGKEVLKLFQCLSDMGNTIVMITHDLSVAEHAKRVVRIVDGELYEN